MLRVYHDHCRQACDDDDEMEWHFERQELEARHEIATEQLLKEALKWFATVQVILP